MYLIVTGHDTEDLTVATSPEIPNEDIKIQFFLYDSQGQGLQIFTPILIELNFLVRELRTYFFILLLERVLHKKKKKNRI